MMFLLRTHPVDEHWDRTSHAVVTIDAALASRLATRHHAFLASREADPDHIETHYLATGVAVFAELDVDVLLRLDDEVTLWEEGWSRLTDGLGVADLAVVDIESAAAVFTTHGLYWACRIEHGEVEVHTSMLPYDVIASLA